jgi:hypothetical protein
LICDLHSGRSSLFYVPTTLIKRDTDAEMFARRLAMFRAFRRPARRLVGLNVVVVNCFSSEQSLTEKYFKASSGIQSA